ncbi:hypothetical protein A2U01_0117506, partial [Trifolium medium]|nr:hypothetical protein [Trifolium medium]
MVLLATGATSSDISRLATSGE